MRFESCVVAERELDWLTSKSQHKASLPKRLGKGTFQTELSAMGWLDKQVFEIKVIVAKD